MSAYWLLDANDNSVVGDVGFVSVPKLVLRDINNVGRVPAGLCPSTAGTTHDVTNQTVPTTTTGNRSTPTGSGVDSEYHLDRNSERPLQPTVPSEYGRYLCYGYISTFYRINLLTELLRIKQYCGNLLF